MNTFTSPGKLVLLCFFFLVSVNALTISSPKPSFVSSIVPQTSSLSHLVSITASSTWNIHTPRQVPAPTRPGSKDVLNPPRSTSTALDLTASVPFKASGSWTAAQCDASPINDAQAPAIARWNAADTDNALNQILGAWSVYDLAEPPNENTFDFTTWLWNIFHYTDYSQCGTALQDVSCSITVPCGGSSSGHAPPAAQLIINSIVFLRQMATNKLEAFKDATAVMSDQMSVFASTFAPQQPKSIGTEVVKALLDVALLGVAAGSARFWNVAADKIGFMAEQKAQRSQLKDTFNAAISFGFAVPKDVMPADPHNEQSVVEALRTTLAGTLNTTSSMTTSWLMNNLAMPYGADATPIKNLISGARILSNANSIAANSSHEQDYWTNVTIQQSQIVYGSMIPVAWRMSTKKFHPFVLRVDKSEAICGKPLPVRKTETSPWLVGNMMYRDTAVKSYWCDPQGNSWYLVSGNYANDYPDPQTSGGGLDGDIDPTWNYYAFRALDGIDPKVLDGKNWAGITLKDMILSSYAGFAQNNFRNGYQLDMKSSSVVNDDMTITESDSGLYMSGGIRTPGFFNFTVCLDWQEAFQTITEKWTKDDEDEQSPICGVAPSTRGVTSYLGPNEVYAPGWCTVHIRQWQINEGNENLAGQYQAEVTIRDTLGLVVGEASKEPNEEPRIIVDSKLPYQLIVDAAGPVDASPVLFWYADQYWDSNNVKDNHCSVGKYDHGIRQMDCGFSCPMPPPPGGPPPPVSATIAHPLPAGAQTAIPGQDSFSNAFIPPPPPAPTSSPSQPPPPNWKPSYIQGTCGFHITQYQKGEKGENLDPGPNYELEITVFEASTNENHHKPKVIAASGVLIAPEGHRVSVQGELEYPLFVTAQRVDGDALLFEWGGSGGQKSDSSKVCKVGKYDSGKREMDCGFPC